MSRQELLCIPARVKYPAIGLDVLVTLQVWNMVAGDSPALSKAQFYSTLRLISLAQVTQLAARMP